MAVARFPQTNMLARWVTLGAVGGIIAGITFVVFEIVLSVILGTGPAAPLRAISAILLGRGALIGGYPAASVVIVGLAVHFGLSLVFGAIFGLAYGALIAFVPLLAQWPWLMIPAATLYGLILWLVNFYLIAPAARWDWFAGANPAVQFFAHTLFFGTVLGLYLGGLITWRRQLLTGMEGVGGTDDQEGY